ncbi:unnamed protein product [Arctia plantaginis]|uniref:Uncharacterized protein n=1 Tax=Arctia plantaginis TaxID=874455 RepID=A0A8S1AAB5_ARCPL|nr:unnamed protein product [Arctia plantaginis]
MKTFAILFVCIQACLVQNVFGQCLGRIGGFGAGIGPLGYGAELGLGAYGYGAELAYPAGGCGLGPYGYGAELGAIAPYGGIGEGNVAVAGELPVNVFGQCLGRIGGLGAGIGPLGYGAELGYPASGLGLGAYGYGSELGYPASGLGLEPAVANIIFETASTTYLIHLKHVRQGNPRHLHSGTPDSGESLSSSPAQQWGL